MQAQAAGYRVEKLRIGDGDGNNMRDVELEEVEFVEHGVDPDVANHDKHKKGYRDEVAQARGYDGVPAVVSHGRSAAGVARRRDFRQGFVRQLKARDEKLQMSR